LYECVQWVLPRKAALQYLKLDDIVDGEASARDPSGECEKFQLSSRHLELLANLSKSNEQSNSFWALAGLGSVLASWGHDVSNFLHSCPCHPPEKSEERERKTKKRRGTMVEDIMHREDDTSCPMGGRMGVAMASGYMRRAVDNLKRAQVPEHTQTVLDALSEETPFITSQLLSGSKKPVDLQSHTILWVLDAAPVGAADDHAPLRGDIQMR